MLTNACTSGERSWYIVVVGRMESSSGEQVDDRYFATEHPRHIPVNDGVLRILEEEKDRKRQKQKR